MAMDSINSTQSLYDVIYQDDGSPVLLIDKIQNVNIEDTNLIDRIAPKEVISTLEPRKDKLLCLIF